MLTFIETRLRVIYFYQPRQEEVRLLTLYAKNVSDNISTSVLKRIKASIDD